MSTDRVFVLGGIGNIGTKVVQNLLAKDVDVTLYTRNPAKVDTMFPNRRINVVKGDFTDLTLFKEGIKGLARLFLLVSIFTGVVEIKIEITRIAYEAGVKQIVDVSTATVNQGWRNSYTGGLHYEAERAIYDLPNRGRLVSLRSNRYMSNLTTFDRPDANGVISDIVDADSPQGWISDNDIGAVAAIIMSGDVERHADSVYTLTGDVVTPAQRCEIFSRVLGREVRYQKITAIEKFNSYTKLGAFPDYVSYNFATYIDDAESSRVSVGISILLGRDPETMEEYLLSNKNQI